MEFVFSIESKDYGALKRVLDENPFADDSFAKNGYTLKESAALGLKSGAYVLYFESADEALAKKLAEKLKTALPNAKETTGEEKAKIIAQIKSESDSAAAGFGSIFG